MDTNIIINISSTDTDRLMQYLAERTADNVIPGKRLVDIETTELTAGIVSVTGTIRGELFTHDVIAFAVELRTHFDPVGFILYYECLERKDYGKFNLNCSELINRYVDPKSEVWSEEFDELNYLLESGQCDHVEIITNLKDL